MPLNIQNAELEELARKFKRVAGRAEDLTRVAKEFEDYTEDKRIPSMLRNGGRVPGPYGRGYKKWAPNTSWVRRAKADKRVFFKHGRSKSSLEDEYKFTKQVNRRRGFVQFKLVNKHEAAKYLQAGFPKMEITAKSPTGKLKIPFGFGQNIFRHSVTRGAMKPRRLDGFRKGDEKKLVQLTADSILEPIR